MSELEKIYSGPDQVSGYYHPQKGIIYGPGCEPDSDMRKLVEQLLNIILAEKIMEYRKRENQIREEFLEIYEEIRERMRTGRGDDINTLEEYDTLNQPQEFSPFELERPSYRVTNLPVEEK